MDPSSAAFVSGAAMFSRTAALALGAQSLRSALGSGRPSADGARRLAARSFNVKSSSFFEGSVRVPGLVRRPTGRIVPAHTVRTSSISAEAAPAPAAKAKVSAAKAGGSKVVTFQEAILRLQEYWASVGCIVFQPHNTEVGAGTMNPATYLRVLGPEPWNVAYPEPSIRPDDSRYGENPNRIQRHTQFQVILKPDPGNPQELYLRSLEVLGIDVEAHDVRFVEDNWESPALGAWGLGWEVWMDGMEVSQFTYFQQAGGYPLEVVSVEITYGLERIVMALQGVQHFRDIEYGNGVKYGEIFGQNEYEMSVYNLDAADIPTNLQMFELHEKEARMLLDKNLPVPAHQAVLKTSHAFNVLDARGAIGVTERARYFGRMRNLSRDVAGAWIARRAELEHPLGVTAALPEAKAAGAPTWDEGKQGQTLLVELGSEELPPDDVQGAAAKVRDGLARLLERERLAYSSLVGLAGRQPDAEREAKGPPVKAAFPQGRDGPASKAAEGFAKKQGVDVAALEVKTIDGAEYVVARVTETGRPTGEVLGRVLPELVAGVTFGKSMRPAPRPRRAPSPPALNPPLTPPAGSPFVAAGLASGRTTRAFRHGPGAGEVELGSASEYEGALGERGLVLSFEERRARILAAAEELAAAAGGRLAGADGGLPDEVANLVEGPTPLLGSFDAAFLELPREVLVTVMRKHQRYFPVEDAADPDRLLPHFVTVANGACDAGVVRAGNEAVIRARYADAQFFWQHDVSRPLEDFVPALASLTFQEKLGSMLDKSRRVEKLAPALAEMAGLSGEELATVARAAALAKADLATQMVVEMTELAGTMGRYYALRSGESAAVAQAVFEHALPRFAGDATPASRPGAVLSVADRVDSLVGLFAAGCQPKATADPFALRRAALGLIATLLSTGVRLDVRAAVAASAATQPIAVAPETQAEVLDFVARRFEAYIAELEGASEAERRPDLIRAVLGARGADPALAVATLRELAAEAESERFGRVMTAYARPARLVRSKAVADVPEDAAVESALFEGEEERALHAALAAFEAAVPDPAAASLGAWLEAFDAVLAGPIDAFFEKVFVMAEEAAVKRNRIALLRRVAATATGLLDFPEIQGF
eukprot:tig00001466_g8778.t1